MNKSKTLDLIKNILTWIVVAIAVLMMIFTIISATTLDRNNRSLFGFKMYKILSDSMKATDFAAGDLIFVKEVDPATLKEGDIISYTSTNTDNFGEVITHKIRRLTTDGNGNPGFVTYGTTTNEDDPKVVTYPYVLGKYCGKLPKLGYFFEFLQTTPGYIVCILIPFVLLILSQGVNSVRLFRKYKAEQNAALEEEKAKLASEKEEMQKMMQELMAMKAQMNSGDNPPAPEVKTEEKTPQPENAETAKMKDDLANVEAEIKRLAAARDELTAKLAEMDEEEKTTAEKQIAGLGATLEKLGELKETISAKITDTESE